jgi:hypothetical protein
MLLDLPNLIDPKTRSSCHNGIQWPKRIYLHPDALAPNRQTDAQKRSAGWASIHHLFLRSKTAVSTTGRCVPCLPGRSLKGTAKTWPRDSCMGPDARARASSLPSGSERPTRPHTHVHQSLRRQTHARPCFRLCARPVPRAADRTAVLATRRRIRPQRERHGRVLPRDQVHPSKSGRTQVGDPVGGLDVVKCSMVDGPPRGRVPMRPSPRKSRFLEVVEGLRLENRPPPVPSGSASDPDALWPPQAKNNIRIGSPILMPRS